MTTGEIIGLVAFLIAIPAVLIGILAVQQHDKDKREREGRPPKKYHSIVDEDVTTVYTIKNKLKMVGFDPDCGPGHGLGSEQ